MVSRAFAKGWSRLREAAARLSPSLKNDRGAVAIWFALVAVPLTVVSLGLVDLNRATTAKANLQDSLDAATLYAARSSAADTAGVQAEGAKALTANMRNYNGVTLTSSSFTLSGSTVVATARASVDPVIANLWSNDDIPVSARAEVVRSSRNVEVALVLDTTYSMIMNNSTKLDDLKLAAKDLVDLIVKPQQTPYYSKVALVPYSIAVNPGTYLNAVRGAQTPAKTITAASWSSGTQKSITGATKAKPVVITSAAHGFSNGDRIWINNVGGMTQLNNKEYVVTNKNTNTFELYTTGGSKVDGTGYSNYTNNTGKVQKCQVNGCYLVLTSNGHGFTNGKYVSITDVVGTTQINNGVGISGIKTFDVVNSTTNTFALNGVDPTYGGGLSAYTSGGSIWCTDVGCRYQRFTNESGNPTVFEASACVTERTGTYKQTDTAAATAKVGFNYPSALTGDSTAYLYACPTATIEPLSSAKDALKTSIQNYAGGGVTAGQVGAEWGWFMISPDFGVFSGNSAPGPYNNPEYLKVIVLMTDGEFNTPYCDGVVAQDAAFGSASAHKNCNANNGDPFTQAKAICTAAKTKGVIIYTVGFQLGSDAGAVDVMNKCATSAKHVYLPNNGTDLKTAFKAIGEDISSLRISR